jgi:hypothetical protein
MSFVGGLFGRGPWPGHRQNRAGQKVACDALPHAPRLVARGRGFCHDPRRSHINGQERLVVAIGIWQVFLVLVIAGLVVYGGGLRPGRPPDGAGR